MGSIPVGQDFPRFTIKEPLHKGFWPGVEFTARRLVVHWRIREPYGGSGAIAGLAGSAMPAPLSHPSSKNQRFLKWVEKGGLGARKRRLWALSIPSRLKIEERRVDAARGRQILMRA